MKFRKHFFRREKLKRNIPTVEEINNRLIQETGKSEAAKQDVRKDDIQFSSEESGSEAVMRRFLGESKSLNRRCN